MPWYNAGVRFLSRYYEMGKGDSLKRDYKTFAGEGVRDGELAGSRKGHLI